MYYFSFFLHKVMNETEAIIWLWTNDWARCDASTPDTERASRHPHSARACMRPSAAPTSKLKRSKVSFLGVCHLRNKQKSGSLKSRSLTISAICKPKRFPVFNLYIQPRNFLCTFNAFFVNWKRPTFMKEFIRNSVRNKEFQLDES